MSQSTFYAAKARFWGLPVPEGRRHGPQTWAKTVYGCSCRTCLPSGQVTYVNDETRERPYTARERNKRSREKLRGRPVPPGVKHGGTQALKAYQCKCGVCKEAQQRKSHREKNPWMYRPTRGHWSSDGFSDMLWWPAKGQTSADCPLANCLHIDHKEVLS